MTDRKVVPPDPTPFMRRLGALLRECGVTMTEGYFRIGGTPIANEAGTYDADGIVYVIWTKPGVPGWRATHVGLGYRPPGEGES